MIKYSCKSCGHKIGVSEEYAGKKGKCPKCKNIIVVPVIDDEGALKLQDAEPELRLEKEGLLQERLNGGAVGGVNVGNQFVQKPVIEEGPAERKYFWILDIFLYPISVSGLVNLGIFWLLPILLGVLQILLPIPIIWGIAGVIVAGYMYCYFMECIRDSASGGLRAPNNIANMPDVSGAFEQAMEIAASIVVFWGPMCGYLIYKFSWEKGGNINYDPTGDKIFWGLLGYGIFFFPMGLLTVAMFDSASAFNPFLWIRMILSTFFQYCGLVLLFCVLGWLVSGIISYFQESKVFTFFCGAVFIYLAMVAAHLLGRFYYLNSQKLDR